MLGGENGEKIIIQVCSKYPSSNKFLTAAVVGRAVLGGRDGLSVGLAVGMLHDKIRQTKQCEQVQ